MQTPKKSSNRNGPSEALSKISPMTSPSPRKKSISGLESATITTTAMKTPKTKSPKMIERKSPRSPASEKKRLDKMNELETRLSKLQEELNKTKDQLTSCESGKKKAQQEAEDAKKQLIAVTEKLEDTKLQLQEISESEDGRIQELRKVGQERDKAWQSELEAVQKQHSIDSSALASAMNEIHRLRLQLDMVANSESAKAKQTELANLELDRMKQELSESFLAIEALRAQLEESEKSEAEYQEVINETHMQLVIANATIDTLRSDGSKLMDSFNCILSELEESKSRVQSLEDIVTKLQSSGQIMNTCCALPSLCSDENTPKIELKSSTPEVKQLTSSLNVAEMQDHEEQMRDKMQIQSACDGLERTKIESNLKETELQIEITETEAKEAELKTNFSEKETQLQMLSVVPNGCPAAEKIDFQENEEKSHVVSKLSNSLEDVTVLKAILADKENELQSILEENGRLKLMVEKKELTEAIEGQELATEAINARVAEREVKPAAVADEEAHSGGKTAKVAELLEASQAAKSEMEAELRRLRIQAVQWKKAAEAAAAILAASEKNGRLVEKTGSLGSDFNTKLMSSPFYDEMENESPKKKNMLKKIGVLWKKGQK